MHLDREHRHMDPNKTVESNRTFGRGGCVTCRRRHLKCDQTQPSCRRCKNSGLECEGFSTSLRWVVSTGLEQLSRQDEDSTDRYARRQLFTEKCRKSMCAELLATRPSAVAAAITEVDDESRGVEEQEISDFTVGPFGVFRAGQKKRKSSASTIPNVPNKKREIIAPEITAPPFDLPPFGFGRLPSPDFGWTGPLDYLQWADLFTWDVDLLGTNSFDLNGSDTQTWNNVNTDILGWQNEQMVDAGYEQRRDEQPPLPGNNDALLWPELDLGLDVPFLIRHFNDNVIDQMGALPIHEKSSWRILNLPAAIMTLSELTILNTDRSKVKHAPLANFYAVLAVSSFHISLNMGSFPDTPKNATFWNILSNRTYAAAKMHINISLEKETLAPEKAKYKDQLMAINATLATAVLSGNMRDSARYLTEMERVIRLRGLTGKGISRRARLLHQVYAWMRIVSESTYVLHDDTALEEGSDQHQEQTQPGQHHNHSRQDVDRVPRQRIEMENSNAIRVTTSNYPAKAMPIRCEVSLDNFLRLEPRTTLIQDKSSDSPKEGESSDHDIHLPDARQDHDSVCMQIYGVPETWLSLVSQTTRLANVMDRLSTGNTSSEPDRVASLQTRASRLENTICSFASRSQTPPMFGSGSDIEVATTNKPHTHMMNALNSALMIYFYRRVRNINPWVLRHDISDVIRSLHAFDEALQQNGLRGPGSAWAAFVAGAEAMVPHQRQEIITWLDTAWSKSGFESYRTSKEVLLETWRRRDEAALSEFSNTTRGDHSPDSNCPTWMEVCRSMQKWPLLC